MCSMVTNDEKSMGYMDLTGRFHHCSDIRHEYLLAWYNYYTNVILVESLKNANQRLLHTYGKISINNYQQQDCNPTYM